MTLEQLIRKTIRLWSKFRASRLQSISDRRIERATPGYLNRKREIEIRRRQHRPVKPIEKAQRDAMTEILRGRANG
jgi:hypothetical protein